MVFTNENDAFLEAARTPVPFLDHAYTTLGAVDFRRLQYGDFVLPLLIQTAEFRSRAQSYRNFAVAAGMLAVRSGQFGRAFGYNIKLDETDRVNIHAEELALRKAEDGGYSSVPVISVIGPVQPDTVSGKDMPTLHPCGQRCRPLLKQSPLVQPNTLVVSARPDFTVIEVATIDALINLHDDGDASGVATFQFESTPQVFSAPQPMPGENGSIRLLDVAEVDDSDWQASVGRYLFELATLA